MPPSQVVRVDSSAAVTVSIRNGPTHSSDIRRLRKAGATPSSSSSDNGSHGASVDVAALERALAAKWPGIAPTARRNPHAQPGTPLHTRFVNALAQHAGRKVVDVLLHGTAEGNIESIKQESLRGSTCWFTHSLPTAEEYARSRGGAKRILAFAVLRDAHDTGPVYTTNDPAHHLPLFEMDRC